MSSLSSNLVGRSISEPTVLLRRSELRERLISNWPSGVAISSPLRGSARSSDRVGTGTRTASTQNIHSSLTRWSFCCDARYPPVRRVAFCERRQQWMTVCPCVISAASTSVCMPDTESCMHDTCPTGSAIETLTHLRELSGFTDRQDAGSLGSYESWSSDLDEECTSTILMDDGGTVISRSPLSASTITASQTTTGVSSSDSQTDIQSQSLPEEWLQFHSTLPSSSSHVSHRQL